MNTDVRDLAYRLLDSNPHPIPRFRTLRDILRVPQQDSEYKLLQQAVADSSFVKELAQSQETNGTWGRFHTRDTKSKRKFPTTEMACVRPIANRRICR